jgi:hypothetical protein
MGATFSRPWVDLGQGFKTASNISVKWNLPMRDWVSAMKGKEVA